MRKNTSLTKSVPPSLPLEQKIYPYSLTDYTAALCFTDAHWKSTSGSQLWSNIWAVFFATVNS